MSLEDGADRYDTPEEDERTGYRLKSFDHFVWAMRKLRDKRRRKTEVQTTAQAEVDRLMALVQDDIDIIRDWERKQVGQLGRDIDWFRSLAEEYVLAERERTKNDRRPIKSISTPYGVARTRGTGAPWDICDEAALLAWLEEHHPELVKTTVKLTEAKKLLGPTVLDGALYDPETGEQVPGVKVGEPGVTASAETDQGLHAEDEPRVAVHAEDEEDRP